MVRILFGGNSHESYVSVASAQHVLEHLPDASAWYIDTQDAVWEIDPSYVRQHANPFQNAFQVPQNAECIVRHMRDLTSDHGVMFLALHGQQFEDGSFQALLAEKNIVFTGSGSEASRRAFYKPEAKIIAESAAIRTARGIVLQHGEKLHFDAKQVVVKPAADGSSVGLYIGDYEHAQAHCDEFFREYSGNLLVEEFISGFEVTISVLDRAPWVLPVSGVVAAQGAHFDYQAKYVGKAGVVEQTPAALEPHIAQEAQRIALEMHLRLGCRGYSRTDMIIAKQGIFFLETNTLPGLTKASFLPQQLACAGIPFVQFLREEIDRAVRQRS